MLDIDYKDSFLKTVRKIKNQDLKEKVKKQIEKIIEYPETGKPMQYERKGTREVYLAPFRLAYSYNPEKNSLIFLNLYRKDEQ